MKTETLNSVFKNLLQIAGVAAVSFLYFFFIVPNQPNKGGAVAVCAIGGIMAMRACWNLSHYAWFWFTLAAVFVIQGGLVLFLPWSTDRLPGMVLLPIGLADFAFVYGALKLVHKFNSQGV